jgi:excisionase family DNA binding protein
MEIYKVQPEPSVEPMLLTTRQAARSLNLSERTLYAITKRGDLPVVRIGKAVRYDPADIRVWIESAKKSEKGLAQNANPL